VIVGRDYTGVGVGAMVFNKHGQVFFAKRADGATNEKGCWEVPGGRLERCEKLVDAILREFREEYGMDIDVVEQLGAFDHILTEENEHWVSVTFIARHVAGIPVILEPTKCSTIDWFSLIKPPSPLSQITRDNLEAYRAKYGSKLDWAVTFP
jgi:8-oxo-dGTP diphosphatase